MEGSLSLFSYGSEGWGDELLRGALTTLKLAALTLPLGVILGLAITLLKRRHRGAATWFAELYTTVFRGLPELLTVLLIYYGLQTALQFGAAALGYTEPIEVNQLLAGVLALALVFGAYASEVLLGAIRNLPTGELVAGKAFGLSPFQCFMHIGLPHGLRLALPGMANIWLSLLKETSLVSVIALDELMRMTSIAARVTREPIVFYAGCCAIYFTYSILSSLIAIMLESRLNRGQRAMGA